MTCQKSPTEAHQSHGYKATATQLSIPYSLFWTANKTTAMKPNESSQVTHQVFDSHGNFLRTQKDCQHIHLIAAYSTLTHRYQRHCS